jgi:DNA-binding transcriptional MerR regulator
MYTVNELEEISGLTRRTIGDYIAKGLLSGPSHRGRGARYSQSDVDVLQIIPRLRTLMKKEFPSLREVHDFLIQRSAYELHRLAGKSSESAFELKVRTLRLQGSLAAILPQVSPEEINLALKKLSPEQITGVDTGRYQLGAVIDMATLLGNSDGDLSHSNTPINGNGFEERVDSVPTDGNRGSTLEPQSSWSVSWLDGSAYKDINEFDAEVADISALESISRRLERMANGVDMESVRHESEDDSGLYALATTDDSAAGDRLADIAKRVERLERLMTTK